ncbi:ClpX C4-type zinc finger protein [Roseomonas sp. CCTCC AB2023176]|uniref:ClpX C4-type zinc finger protein n=1 Tax=Roseomonas sp. CCTCC AB2023176 TaxID=3342640 RepID=UPI0035D9D59F
MSRRLHCSFCGRSEEEEVRKLAAGPGGVHICDECVAACAVLMEGEAEGRPRRFDPAPGRRVA